MTSEIKTEPRRDSYSRVQGTPAFEVEYTVGADLDPRATRVSGEERRSKRATRPVAGTDERDSEQVFYRSRRGTLRRRRIPSSRRPEPTSTTLSKERPVNGRVPPCVAAGALACAPGGVSGP